MEKLTAQGKYAMNNNLSDRAKITAARMINALLTDGASCNESLSVAALDDSAAITITIGTGTHTVVMSHTEFNVFCRECQLVLDSISTISAE